MNASERIKKIESYGQAHQLLIAALERFPKEMWHYKPDKEQWSIHEIIVHITDSEANSYIRSRRFIAEPGSTLMAYDENVWARALRYNEQSTEDAVALFRWLRKLSYTLVKDLPERVWRHQAYHPESGMMTMDDWLDTYERHVPEHIHQMEGVLKRWQKEGQ
jgi:hypothetical protein